MADEDESVKVVCGEDLGDCETGSLPAKRGTGYSIANGEYLYDDDTKVGIPFYKFPDERKVGQ